MNKDIVSTNEEDKPLIFISEEAINLKRDNDKLKQEIERLNKDNKDLQSITNIEMSKSEYLEQENERYRIAINEMAIIISKAIEYIKINGNWWTDEIEGCQDLIKILKGEEDGNE